MKNGGRKEGRKEGRNGGEEEQGRSKELFKGGWSL